MCERAIDAAVVVTGDEEPRGTRVRHLRAIARVGGFVVLLIVAAACGSAPPSRSAAGGIGCTDAWPISDTARPSVHPHVPLSVLQGRSDTTTREHDRAPEIDWASLARAEVLAHRDLPTLRAWIVGDLVIRDVGALRVQANDLRTLETRWTHDGDWFRHGVGCDRVVQTSAGTVRALEARSGTELWRRDIGDVGRSGLAEIVALEGCRVILEMGDGRYDGSNLDVWILDATTGRTVVRHELGEPGTTSVASEREAVAWLRERAVAIPLDGHELVSVPPDAELLSVTRTIHTAANDLIGRDRRTGEIAWSRTFEDRPAIVGRAGDDIIVTTRGEIRRIAMETGEDRWALAVPLELMGYADGWMTSPSSADVVNDRLILSSYTEPPLIAQVDLAAGTLSWVRLAPQRLGGVAITGDHAVVWTQESIATIALPTDGASLMATGRGGATVRDPAHEARVRDEIRRSLGLLALPERERSTSYQYPASAAEARTWLERLRPSARQILVEEIRAGSDRDAATGIAVLAGDVDPFAHALVEELLRRSFGPATPDRVALRAAASRAVSRPLSPELARELADETLAWSIDLRNGPAHTCGPHPLDPLADAVHASFAALERASTDPELVDLRTR